MHEELLNAEEKDHFVARIVLGVTRRNVCRGLNIPYSWFMDCYDGDPGFWDRVCRAELDFEVHHLQAIRGHHKMWRADAWLLERVMPDTYGRKPPRTVSHDQMEALIEMFAAAVRDVLPPKYHRRVARAVRRTKDGFDIEAEQHAGRYKRTRRRPRPSDNNDPFDDPYQFDTPASDEAIRRSIHPRDDDDFKKPRSGGKKSTIDVECSVPKSPVPPRGATGGERGATGGESEAKPPVAPSAVVAPDSPSPPRLRDSVVSPPPAVGTHRVRHRAPLPPAGEPLPPPEPPPAGLDPLMARFGARRRMEEDRAAGRLGPRPRVTREQAFREQAEAEAEAQRLAAASGATAVSAVRSPDSTLGDAAVHEPASPGATAVSAVPSGANIDSDAAVHEPASPPGATAVSAVPSPDSTLGDAAVHEPASSPTTPPPPPRRAPLDPIPGRDDVIVLSLLAMLLVSQSLAGCDGWQPAPTAPLAAASDAHQPPAHQPPGLSRRSLCAANQPPSLSRRSSHSHSTQLDTTRRRGPQQIRGRPTHFSLARPPPPRAPNRRPPG